MGITRCISDCRLQLKSTSCLELWGCEWKNSTVTEWNNSTENSMGSCLGIGGAGDITGGTVWIGMVLALVGNIVINLGMNAMKHAHNINSDDSGKLLLPFYKIPWWWIGVVGLVGGELANIIAYGYAPASIVTPMGAIGVLTNVIITTFVLREPFRAIQRVAFLIAGIALVVYFAPSTEIKITSQTMWSDWLFTVEFAVYMSLWIVSVPCFLLLGRKYGESTVLVHITTCSIIASLTIVCAKTFSALLKSAIEHGFAEDWASPVPYVALFFMSTTAVASMGFVNKAMMLFGNSVVVPTYYALFTISSVGSVAWVFREFDCLSQPLNLALFLLGLCATILGVMLLQCSRQSELEDKDNVKDAEGTPQSPNKHETPNGSRMSAIWGSGFTGAAVIYPLAASPAPSKMARRHTSPHLADSLSSTTSRKYSFVPLVPSRPAVRHASIIDFSALSYLSASGSTASHSRIGRLSVFLSSSILGTTSSSAVASTPVEPEPSIVYTNARFGGTSPSPPPSVCNVDVQPLRIEWKADCDDKDIPPEGIRFNFVEQVESSGCGRPVMTYYGDDCDSSAGTNVCEGRVERVEAELECRIDLNDGEDRPRLA